MTFDELRLAIAIRQHGVFPGDGMPEVERIEYALQVARLFCLTTRNSRFAFDTDDVIRCALSIRKNVETRTKADVAEAHGVRCFWHGRGKGPCCETAECGHLVPASKGGPLSIENCVIECRSHNNQRRAMLVEEYLLSDLTTGPRHGVAGGVEGSTG